MRIGVDEAGRGPVVGPLVVAAVAADEGGVARLASLGAADSKTLDAESRQRIAAAMEAGAEEGWLRASTIVADAERIDRMMALGSLNEAEVILFVDAIRGLGFENEPVAAGGLLALDACDVDEARFGRRVHARLGTPWRDWRIRSEHAPDAKDTVVGAASILAKVARDAAIRRIEADLGFPIGSGYPSDPTTIAALPRLVAGGEPHHHLRWAWTTTARAWRKVHGSPLPSRPPPSDARVGDQATLDRF